MKRVRLSQYRHLLIVACWILLSPAVMMGRMNHETSRDTVDVMVTGVAGDARFVPDRLTISKGVVVRFRVMEGIHTVTAYHPDNRRDLGIPEGAVPFDSGPLGPGSEWNLQLKLPGEYNYFCIPHELMGHTGRIFVTEQTETDR